MAWLEVKPTPLGLLGSPETVMNAGLAMRKVGLENEAEANRKRLMERLQNISNPDKELPEIWLEGGRSGLFTPEQVMAGLKAHEEDLKKKDALARQKAAVEQFMKSQGPQGVPVVPLNAPAEEFAANVAQTRAAEERQKALTAAYEANPTEFAKQMSEYLWDTTAGGGGGGRGQSSAIERMIKEKVDSGEWTPEQGQAAASAYISKTSFGAGQLDALRAKRSFIATINPADPSLKAMDDEIKWRETQAKKGTYVDIKEFDPVTGKVIIKKVPFEESIGREYTISVPRTQTRRVQINQGDKIRVQRWKVGYDGNEVMVGEEIYPVNITPGVLTDRQKKRDDLDNLDASLRALKLNVTQNTFTYAQRLGSGTQKLIDKIAANPEEASPEDAEFYRQQAFIWESFNSYVKSTTGAQMSEVEVERLKKAFMNGEMSWEQFKSVLAAQEEAVALKKSLLAEKDKSGEDISGARMQEIVEQNFVDSFLKRQMVNGKPMSKGVLEAYAKERNMTLPEAARAIMTGT